MVFNLQIHFLLVMIEKKFNYLKYTLCLSYEISANLYFIMNNISVSSRIFICLKCSHIKSEVKLIPFN